MDNKNIIIYHNPKCSKSRQALTHLQEQGFEPEIKLYLINPPTPQDIKHILQLLNKKPRDIIRSKEDEYKQQNLDNLDLTDDELITAVVNTPKLLERPIIIIDNNRAAIARPLEDLINIL